MKIELDLHKPIRLGKTILASISSLVLLPVLIVSLFFGAPLKFYLFYFFALTSVALFFTFSRQLKIQKARAWLKDTLRRNFMPVYLAYHYRGGALYLDRFNKQSGLFTLRVAVSGPARTRIINGPKGWRVRRTLIDFRRNKISLQLGDPSLNLIPPLPLESVGTILFLAKSEPSNIWSVLARLTRMVNQGDDLSSVRVPFLTPRPLATRLRMASAS